MAKKKIVSDVSKKPVKAEPGQIVPGSFVISKNPKGVEYIAEVEEVDSENFTAKYKKVFLRDNSVVSNTAHIFKEYIPDHELTNLPDSIRTPDLERDRFDLNEAELISTKEFEEVIMPNYFPNKENFG